jgi:AraC family transcriptional regulator
MRAACHELDDRDSSSPFALEALGMELVALCARHHGAIPRRAPAWLARVRDRLREESSHQFTIASLAAEAGVHPVHLARVFRRFLGASPGEFWRACRIDRARHLLVSALPLCEVAQAAGFYDQSQLANAFKRATGLRPSVYRRRFGR